MDVTYQADGREMVGRLALPAGDGPCAGVLIAHEGNGLDDVQKARPSTFAELGYAAFAMDYHGGGRPLTDRDAINERLTALSDDPDRARAIGRAGLEVLLSQPRVQPGRIAAVGYCFGGTMVLELARDGADLKAVIGVHPGLTPSRPQDSANIRGTVMICIGADDPIVPLNDRIAFEEEMRTAGIDWQMHVLGNAGHSFAHPRIDDLAIPGLSYDPRADRRAWRAVVGLLAEVVPPTLPGTASEPAR